jgi:hypothetical protein
MRIGSSAGRRSKINSAAKLLILLKSGPSSFWSHFSQSLDFSRSPGWRASSYQQSYPQEHMAVAKSCGIKDLPGFSRSRPKQLT